jgi:hypothetical protein
MYTPSLLSTFIKEPLLHFLLIGVGLFLLYAQINTQEISDNKQTIIIKKSILTQMIMDFKDENNRDATKEERQILLEKAIREEVLYHEALTMGLDKEDTVIRHRLAEKVSYLFEDISILEEPSDEILKIYLKEHTQDFNQSVKYEELKTALKEAWIAQEQAQENEAFYNSLKNRYKIILELEIQ